MGIRRTNDVVQVSLPLKTAFQALAVLLLLAAWGCGTSEKTAQKPAKRDAVTAAAEKQSGADAKTAVSNAESRASKPRVEAGETPVARGPANRVRLVDKDCIQFEPQWTTIHPGQSLEWHSDLKTPVTIHVSPGAFAKTEYVVRPGTTVSTGPSHAMGSFSIWTEPASCQGIARGVQGSGPGFTVGEIAPK